MQEDKEEFEENEELFEHYKIIADKGQAVLRIDKFLTTDCLIHLEIKFNKQHMLSKWCKWGSG